MVSLVNSDPNATRIRWYSWEIDIRFAPELPPGWQELSSACPPLPPSPSQATLHLYLQRYLLVSIAGSHTYHSLLNFLKISLAEIPHTPPHRELYNFYPLKSFLRDPSNPSSFLIPLAATPSPSAAAQIHHQRQPPWTVWCVKPAPEKKPLRNGLPRPPPSNTPIPTGKYSLTNLYKCGTPRFVAIPFKEYLSATHPQPRNELIPPSQNPSSQIAQPSPPITELVPQSNTPVASTRPDPPSNTPAKRVRLSEQVSPTPPPQGLLPTKHPAPPTRQPILLTLLCNRLSLG